VDNIDGIVEETAHQLINVIGKVWTSMLSTCKVSSGAIVPKWVMILKEIMRVQKGGERKVQLSTRSKDNNGYRLAMTDLVG